MTVVPLRLAQPRLAAVGVRLQDQPGYFCPVAPYGAGSGFPCSSVMVPSAVWTAMTASGLRISRMGDMGMAFRRVGRGSGRGHGLWVCTGVRVPAWVAG